MTDAMQAADRHDLSRLHPLVRRLNPKEETARIQIRDASGRILSPIEEFISLKHYVQTTWHGTPFHLSLLRQVQGYRSLKLTW